MKAKNKTDKKTQKMLNIVEQTDNMLKEQMGENTMENRIYTYLEVKESEYKKLKKIFNWKNEYLRHFVRFDDFAKRVYINHLDELPSVIRIILQNDETIRFNVYVNRDISIESVVGRR